MIDFVFLNWKLSKKLYSTEIIEKSQVEKLSNNLDKIITEYKCEKLFPLSDIFYAENKDDLNLVKIKEFIDSSLENCQVDTESDLEAYKKLLGPDMRHGEKIFLELFEMIGSILEGKGEYDPVRTIDQFLLDPYRGVSPIMVQAIKSARNALESVHNTGTNLWGDPRTSSITLKNIFSAADIDTSGIDPDKLKIPVRIFQDDGMGYGAVNGNCFDAFLSQEKDKKTIMSLWF